MKGQEIQDAIAQLARTKGYRVAHFSPGRVGPRDSWITNWAYDSKGWPDLLMVGHGRIVAIEVKGTGDKLKPEQQEWLNALRDAGVVTAVVTPADWVSGVVERML